MYFKKLIEFASTVILTLTSPTNSSNATLVIFISLIRNSKLEQSNITTSTAPVPINANKGNFSIITWQICSTDTGYKQHWWTPGQRLTVSQSIQVDYLHLGMYRRERSM